MKTRMSRIVTTFIATLTALAAWDSAAFASSDFRLGQTFAEDQLAGEATSIAVCRLFLGPRGDLAADQFLLQITDVGLESTGEVLELRGSVIRDESGLVTLSADDAAAQAFYEEILEKKLHLSAAEFDLRRLLAHVGRTADDIGDSTITCGVRMLGFLRPAPDPKPTESGAVALIYGGSGLMFEGIEEEQAAPVAELDAPAQTVCQKPNFAPRPEFCDTSGGTCLVTFAGYQWWTEYDFFSPPASPPTRQDSGFWNANNLWSPRNVTVDAEGLHLFVREQDTLDNRGQCCVRRWTSGEAVTALNLDNSLATLGYGTYLVAARVKSAASWDAMDPNVAFGVFTYERVGTGDINNPQRELDLAEVSRWGRRGTEQQCRDEGRVKPPKLCEGNAQFTLQLWDKGGAGLPNLFRYTVGGASGGTNEITLVMIWTGAQQPVTFRQYNGLHTLATLPQTPNNEWVTPAAQNPWVPGNGCQQFHLNLWMGNYGGATNGFNPPPGSVQEVVVTNFQYEALEPSQ